MNRFPMIVLIICMTWLYVASIWCIDISISSMMLTQCSGNTIVVGGLFFDNVEPRITYHLAISALTGIWLTICSILIWKTLKENENKVVKF